MDYDQGSGADVKMNIREGMRRLGLVAGLLGAGAGAIVAYTQLQSLLARRDQFNTFQTLASSQTVKREVEQLKRDTSVAGAPDTLPWDFFTKLAVLCGEVNGWKVNKNGIGKVYFSGSTCSVPEPAVGEKWPEMAGKYSGLGKVGEINMIETEDGQKVPRTDPPSFGSYFLLATFPVVGFLLPWGAIWVLTWVGRGFFQSPSQ